MKYENKFNLTVEENVFVAKRNLVDTIYKSAKLEGLSVTYPDTYTIINGGKVQGLTTDEVVTINNLKYAWQFILDNISEPTNYALICEINRIVGANLIYGAGYVRTIPVKIAGMEWTPPLPIESDIKDEIAATLKIDNETERSITLMLRLMRRQMFVDGNKRTAILAANHHMIQNGCGIIAVPESSLAKFLGGIIDYYQTNDMGNLLKFVYDNGVDGISLDLMRNTQNESSKQQEKPSLRTTLAVNEAILTEQNQGRKAGARGLGDIEPEH